MATILIAEAGNAIETLVGAELREKGHEVLHAPIEKISEGKGISADLVLMEVPADPDQAQELVRPLAARNVATVIAIVPATVVDQPGARLALLKSGAADCLSAPVHPGEAIARIELRLAWAESARKLRSRSGIDPESGAYSRWLFERRLAEEHMKASRYPMPLACLLVALDNFEALKTRYGNPFAETVLCELGLIIQHSLRISDFVARYGPAEFAVLLPFTGATDALVCAERIRGRTEVFPFRHEKISANATVSVGVSGYSPKRTPDPPALVNEARICLDFAFKHGGDQVVADEGYMPSSVQESASHEGLLEHLRSDDELVQIKAYHALREAGDRATPTLLRGVQDSKADVRRYCAWVLGFIAAKNAGPPITPLLKDRDRDVRAVAAWALGRIGDPTGVPALIEAIADEDSQVRAAAALSVSTLSKHALKPNVSGTPEELRAEAEKCKKSWTNQTKVG
jgi:diguanylate cyclase (GGDEF)-like protein